MPQLPAPIVDTFMRQAHYCGGPGLSPFAAAACRAALRVARSDTAFGRAIAGWTGDPGADALALRAIAGFHALKRRGQSPELDAVYPPNPLDPEALVHAFGEALVRHDDFLTHWLEGPPQTNEPNRSGILLGGFLTIASETGLPLRLFEIGASGGLNLSAVEYHYNLGQHGQWGGDKSGVDIHSEWRGDAPATTTPLKVESALGCDLNPLDVVAEKERLLAYIWPDQSDRLQRLQAAISYAERHPAKIEKADAADWVKRNLVPRPGSATLLYHTIVWQYLPQSTKDDITAQMEAQGANTGKTAPLYWFRCEADESGKPGARLTLTRWPDGQTREMGRADFHGRWVDWA